MLLVNHCKESLQLSARKSINKKCLIVRQDKTLKTFVGDVLQRLPAQKNKSTLVYTENSHCKKCSPINEPGRASFLKGEKNGRINEQT